MSNQDGMRIDQDDLLTASNESLVRLANFVKLTVNPNWDRETLARKLYWEINPPPVARMY